MADDFEEFVQLFPGDRQPEMRKLTRQLAEHLALVDMGAYAEMKSILEKVRAENVDWNHPPAGYEDVRERFNKKIIEVNARLPKHLKFDRL